MSQGTCFAYAKTKMQISCAVTLSGNRAADQCLCFRYVGSTIPLLPKSLAIFCDCTAGRKPGRQEFS